jgi:hypothetical protein
MLGVLIVGVPLLGIGWWSLLVRIHERRVMIDYAAIQPVVARCKECGRKIQRCEHALGVPSNWEHCGDRLHYHANGTVVEHV